MSPRTREPLPPIPDVLQTYLREAAFLYQRRLDDLSAIAGNWEDAALREERMEQQMEGLCLGGTAAFEMFAPCLSEPEEPGQAFTAALLCARLETRAPKEALEAALGAPVPHRPELIDALRFATDAASERWLVHLLREGSPDARRAVLEAAVLRPCLLDAAPALLDHSDPLVALSAARTLLAAGRDAKTSSVTSHLGSSNPAIGILALELAMRASPLAGADVCRAVAADADARVLTAVIDLLAIPGQAGSLRHIRKVVEARPELAPSGWVALGLTGDLAALEYLRARLDAAWELPDQLAELRALVAGARLLTGQAALPAFNPHDFEPAELDAFRQQAKGAWDTFERSAQKTQRYRRGEPLSTRVLARDLIAPGHPRRDLCQLQLAVGYNCRLPFDARAPFAAQRAAARAIASWAG